MRRAEEVDVALEVSQRRSRRSLITGAIGVVAATAAATLGQAVPASAHDPDDVWLGHDNTATSLTRISVTAADTAAFRADGKGSGVGLLGKSETGYGISGSGVSGVLGTGTSIGVHGSGSAGAGVYGESASSNGVYGQTSATNQAGVLGYGVVGACGVMGASGVILPGPVPDTAVYGYTDTAGGLGVKGYAAGATGACYGMWGQSLSSTGVGVVGNGSASRD